MADGASAPIHRIADPHWHVWDTRPRSEGGRGPNSNLGDLADKFPRYTWGDIKEEWGDLPLKACVHVEATVGLDAASGPVDPLEETDRVLAEEISVPFAISAHVSLHLEGAEDCIVAHKAKTDKVTAVRQILNFVDGDAALTYPTITHNYLKDERFRSQLPLLHKHGLAYDCHIAPEQMLAAAEVFKRDAPDLCVVVNHFACPRFGREGADDEAMWRLWREGIRALAACPNVYLKLSNPAVPCVDFNTNPAAEAILQTLVDESIEAFGIERCMFASNFPVDRHQCGVTLVELYDFFNKWTSKRTPEERDALFYKNAVKFYNIPGAEE